MVGSVYKCRKHGEHSDWYVMGRHRACRPCQRQAVKDYASRQALGQTAQRHSTTPRPLYASLTRLDSPVATRRRAQTLCKRRHALSGSNVRFQTDGKGRVHRVCRACHALRQRARYGLPAEPGTLADMLADAQD